jgi:hypothetical protein
MYIKINLCSTLFMTGLIWIVQIIQYPSFIFFSNQNFETFHNFHTSSISMIVGFPMVMELFASLWIYWESKTKWNLVNLMIVIMIWLVTFFSIVPIHNQLALGYNLELIQKLIALNWIRTILWSIKSFLLLFQLKLAE